MRMFFDWLDSRLGYRSIRDTLRSRTLPGGPSWLLTSASVLFWLLVLECATGLMLMSAYSPSMNSAWASVHFIDRSDAGRFLRGLHHVTSHAIIVLLILHVVRVLLTAGFRAPRELIWITGLLMIPAVVVWTVTGNPLAGGHKGMTQIEVEGNILGAVPVVGPPLQRLLIGGDEVGNLTLTHLYFLHVGLLPLVVGGLCAVHLHQVYRHGLQRSETTAGQTGELLSYWPHQTVRNMTVLAAVVGGLGWWSWVHGAPLDAPADPALPSTPRPEWYFRWIFELRRHFTGDSEWIVTVLLPGAVLGFFMLLPLFNHWLPRRVGAAFRLIVVAGSLGGWGWLTYVSYERDLSDPEFRASQRQARDLAARAQLLADHLPVTAAGAAQLLRADPLTQGPLLFAKHCAACHSHVDAAGQGIVAAQPSAPNLYGFATPEWIAGFLDPERISSEQVFGKTKFHEGDMVGAMRALHEGAADDAARAALRQKLQSVASALAAEAALPARSQTAPLDEAAVAAGRTLIASELGCVDCHKFGDAGELGSAPDLTGYGSRAWLRELLSNVGGPRFYTDDRNDRMPAFAADAVHPERNQLSAEELDLLADWLRGEWFEPAAPAPDAPAAPATRQESPTPARDASVAGLSRAAAD